jgi:hypothetical protein
MNGNVVPLQPFSYSGIGGSSFSKFNMSFVFDSRVTFEDCYSSIFLPYAELLVDPPPRDAIKKPALLPTPPPIVTYGGSSVSDSDAGSVSLSYSLPARTDSDAALWTPPKIRNSCDSGEMNFLKTLKGKLTLELLTYLFFFFGNFVFLNKNWNI